MGLLNLLYMFHLILERIPVLRFYNCLLPRNRLFIQANVAVTFAVTELIAQLVYLYINSYKEIPFNSSFLNFILRKVIF